MPRFLRLSSAVISAVIGLPGFAAPAAANTLTYFYIGADYTGYYASNLESTGLHTPFDQGQLNSFATNLGPHLTITVTIDVRYGELVGPLNGTYILSGFTSSAPGFDYVGTMSFVSGLAIGNSGTISGIRSPSLMEM